MQDRKNTPKIPLDALLYAVFADGSYDESILAAYRSDTENPPSLSPEEKARFLDRLRAVTDADSPPASDADAI